MTEQYKKYLEIKDKAHKEYLKDLNEAYEAYFNNKHKNDYDHCDDYDDY